MVARVKAHIDKEYNDRAVCLLKQMLVDRPEDVDFQLAGIVMVEAAQEVQEGEDGEVGEDIKEQYDVDRLITWPGFNGEAKQFRDDSCRYRVRPCISWEHSPAELERRLGAKKQRSYVRGEM